MLTGPSEEAAAAQSLVEVLQEPPVTVTYGSISKGPKDPALSVSGLTKVGLWMI